MSFLVLRDHSGHTIQAVIGEETLIDEDPAAKAHLLLPPLESVVSLDGRLKERPAKDQTPTTLWERLKSMLSECRCSIGLHIHFPSIHFKEIS